MTSKLKFPLNLKISNQSNYLILFWLLVYTLVIGQDYIYSELRHTGFYWSEVLLFNIYWLLFIPFLLSIKNNNFIFQIRNKPRFAKVLNLGFLVMVLSLLHVLVFTSLITLISNISFSSPHLFLNTLVSSISNDLHFTVLVYFIMLYLILFSNRKSMIDKKEKKSSIEKFIFKKDNEQASIKVSSIYYFYSNKPYVSLHTKDKRILLNQSLKSIAETLDEAVFLRVHRSTIVNKHFIKKIISRKNGDYDIVLDNDKVLRLSRHYRKNWEMLIEPSR